MHYIRCFTCLVLISHIGCLNSSKSLSSNIAASGQIARDGANIEFEDTISIDSPMTPLAEAIRRYAMTALNRQNVGQAEALKPHQGSLPLPVKNAIMDTLLAQKNLSHDDVSTKDRPCRVDSDLITPAEIMYSLKRATVGKVGRNNGYPRAYWGKPWNTVLGYGQVRDYFVDLADINLKMEDWFDQLEKEGVADQRVKRSFGLATVPVREFDLKVLKENFGFALVTGHYPDMDRKMEKLIGPPLNHSMRCFVAGQMRYAKIDSANDLNLLKNVDPYENLRILSLPIKESVAKRSVEYVNGKDSINGLELLFDNASFSEAVGWEVTKAPLNICSFKLSGFERLTRDAQSRIKRISLVNALTLNFSSSFDIFPKDILGTSTFSPWLAAAVSKEFKKVFPDVTVYKFFGYPAQGGGLPQNNFFGFLFNSIGRNGAKRVILTSAYMNELMEKNINLERVETLVVDAWGSRINLPLLLKKTQNVQNLVIRHAAIAGNMDEISKIKGPFRLEGLSVTSCVNWLLNAADPKVTLSGDQFPRLSHLRISEGCLDLVNTPAQLKDVLAQLTPFEWIDLLRQQNGSNDGTGVPSSR